MGISIMQTLSQCFQKHISIFELPTRGNNTLDLVYTTHKGAYRASPLPHIRSSDHTTVMLIPAYRSKVKVIKPVLNRYGYGQKEGP